MFDLRAYRASKIPLVVPGTGSPLTVKAGYILRSIELWASPSLKIRNALVKMNVLQLKRTRSIIFGFQPANVRKSVMKSTRTTDGSAWAYRISAAFGPF